MGEVIYFKSEAVVTSPSNAKPGLPALVPGGPIVHVSMPRVDADVVAELEAVLQGARAGHITAFAMAYVTPEGGVGTAWIASGGERQLQTMGAISVLAHELSDDYMSDGAREMTYDDGA